MRDSRIILLLLLLIVLYGGSSCRKSETEDSSVRPAVIKTNSGIEMVLLDGGFFQMGSAQGNADERPVHKVWLGPFLIDKCEVTQELYKRFPLPDPSHFKDPARPVEQMTWTDAIEYCNERSKAEGLEPCYDLKTGKCNFQADGYRLPTEAEWEYACRAGTKTRYFFGDDARKLKNYAWFANDSLKKTQPVGKKRPNPWGLHDMLGNVAEWCHDFYSPDYYQKSPEKNPLGPAKGRQRVLRGGAWNNGADTCRSSYRSGDPSINDTCHTSDAIGFRCVRGLAQSQEKRDTEEQK